MYLQEYEKKQKQPKPFQQVSKNTFNGEKELREYIEKTYGKIK